MLVSALHPSKTLEPILVIPDGIEMQASRAASIKSRFPDACHNQTAISILVSELHSLKAEVLIPVTPDGIEMLFSELHPEKVEESIYVTPDGILMSVNELQP